MAQDLNEEGCLRLLAAVVMQWWREAERPDDADELAAFLGVERLEVRSRRPLRIDVWRRKSLVGPHGPEYEDDDVYS